MSRSRRSWVAPYPIKLDISWVPFQAKKQGVLTNHVPFLLVEDHHLWIYLL
jgi:hypothetical protein